MMKQHLLLFVLFGLIWWSCSDEDDDVNPFTTQLSISTDVNEAEEGTTIELDFTLSEANTMGSDLIFSYLASGSASSSDYSGASGSVTIANGESTAQISILLIDDDEVENTEEITVSIDANALPEGISTGSPSSVTISILDNDFPYEDGVFIINEGNFGSGNGSVSFLAEGSDQIENGIFSMVNGFDLGDVVQSMTIAGSSAYIVVNASNKVEVVNYHTFESTGTITEQMANPRYLLAHDGIGYLSNWGNFDENFNLDQSFISLIDLSSNTVIDTIHVSNGAENMMILDGKLFVSNNFQNTVEVIDLENNTVEASVVVGNAPGQFTWTGEELWVICGGIFNGNDGQLYQINVSDYSVLRTENLGFNPSTRTAYDADSNDIYFYSGNTVYHFNPALDVDPPVNAFIENPEFIGLYSIGFNNSSNQLLLGDAVGFAGAGAVYIYNQDGSTSTPYQSGTGPSEFVFTP